MNNTLLKGVQIIEFMAGQCRAMGIKEIADAVQLQRSAVHRLLQGWVDMGYVLKIEGSQYQASLKLWEVAVPLIRDLDIKHYAADAMRELAAASGETIILSVLDNSDVIFMDQLESHARVRTYTVVGGRAPAALTASGKVQIAFASSAAIEAAINHARAARPDLDEYYAFLPQELKEIKDDGYATNFGYWHAEVGGVASAVIGPDDKPVAAIGLSAPISRLNAHRVEELRPFITSAANRVSMEIQRRRECKNSDAY